MRLFKLVNKCFFVFFLFLISKNVLYTNGYSMQEKHRANLENTRRRKQKKKTKKENQQHNNYNRERELRKEGRETRLGSFTLHIPIQGKTIEGEARNLL